MAPQKAPIPPISAATVASAEPRFLASPGDRGVRDGQRPQTENRERACDVEPGRVLCRDGQQLEHGGGVRCHPVGAFGA